MKKLTLALMLSLSLVAVGCDQAKHEEAPAEAPAMEAAAPAEAAH